MWTFVAVQALLGRL